MAEQGKPLFVSLGHRYRCDDGVGPYMLDLLWEGLGAEVEYWESGGDLLELLTAWSARDVVLLDAVRIAGKDAGTVIRLNALQRTESAGVISSHGLNLADILSLSQIVGSQPASLTIYGISGKDFRPGATLSPSVRAAAARLVAEVIEFYRIEAI